MMNSARRVYETPELMSLIFGHMERRDLRRLLTLKQSFFPSVAALIWQSVHYDIVKATLDLWNPRGRIYVHAIREVIVTDPTLDSDPTTQFALISALLDDFPNLRTATRRLEYLPHLTISSWKSTFDNLWKMNVESIKTGSIEEGTSENWIVVHLRTEWVFEPETDLDQLEPPVCESGEYWIEHYIDVVLDSPPERPGFGFGFLTGFNEADRHEVAISQYINYLTDPDRRHARICSFDAGSNPFALSDLARLIRYRHPGHLDITKVRATDIDSFTIETFETFCQWAGDGGKGENLEVLHLDQRGYSIFDLLSFSRALKAIVEHFPNLVSIEIPISISITTQGRRSDLVPVTEIGVVQAEEITRRLTKLRHFTISVYGGGLGARHVDRYAFPVDTIAKNLAIVVAPAPAPKGEEKCRFGIKNRTSVFLGYNVSKQLDDAVHEIHRSTEHSAPVTAHADDPPSYRRTR
ncbi:hypothetical protein IAR55_006950 [Kwoniella newhampshirensis]|uniref:F-box domain-containing protein n=1 Tax=Kwoniella newhampshirensis TaxID=1651941 RepID=A0AAW0YT38_9TREE